MDLSDKIICNLVYLSSACLRGDKINAGPLAMSELWGDISAATAYVQRDQTPPGQVICANPAEEHG